MRYLPIALFASLVPFSAAHAEQWRVTSLNTEVSKQLIMFVDQDSITRSGNVVKGNVMTVMELTRPIGEGGFTVSIIEREIDCSGKQSRMLYSRYYHEGKMLEENAKPSTWRAIAEGSMIEGVASAMCGTGSYITDKVTDPINFGFQLFKITTKL